MNWKLPGIVMVSLTLVTYNPFELMPVEAKTKPDPRYPSFGTPTYISEKWQASPYKSSEEITFSYLKAKKKLFRLNGEMKKQFLITDKQMDSSGKTHIRLIRKYQNIPVYGSDQTIHIEKNGSVSSFIGKVAPDLEQKNIPTKPMLSIDDAITAMNKQLSLNVTVQMADVSLVILPMQNNFYLTYLIKASTFQPEPGYWHIFIDAIDGQVRKSYNSAHSLRGQGKGVLGDIKRFEIKQNNGEHFLYDQSRNILTYDAKNQPYSSSKLPGKLITSSTTTFKDPAAVDAHSHTQEVFDYYQRNLERNGFDNKGSEIISSVHVGIKWVNAMWNGKQMMYGDGDGRKYKPLSVALDVVAHELTHAVTQYTADLEYMGQSGALNESISDIMGAVIDDDDWYLGEDIGEVLRSLSNPTMYNQPDHFSKYKNLPLDGDNDNGGVHINSGINNKAAYLIAQGGSHYGITVDGIGRAKMAKIYYHALNYYLTTTSDFAVMKQATIQAAIDLYGDESSEKNAVIAAYQAVGI